MDCDLVVNRKTDKMKIRIRLILLSIIVILVVFMGWNYSLQGFTVSGRSMEPSLVNGEWLLVDKLSYHFSSPKRGDIIVFNPPLESSQPYIKRIIGMPGERIEIKDGRIYISNDEGDFEYVETTALPDISFSCNDSWEIPEGHYFVLGDNRPVSGDSRKFGPVPEDNIIGKVFLHYSSPVEWGFSPAYSATLEGY